MYTLSTVCPLDLRWKTFLGDFAMPIYEYYCRDCHTIYNFFSRRVNTEKIPACPKCGRAQLARQVSLFALSKGRKEEDAESDVFDNVDEAAMEKAMASLTRDMEKMDDEDPRQAASLMRKLFQQTGLRMGAGMEEALKRMESGEDPDRIEEEMSDVLEDEDPFAVKPKPSLADLKRRYLPPKIDETLYDL